MYKETRPTSQGEVHRTDRDPYVSRLDEGETPKLIPRQDPVVWSRDREGPLGSDQRDAFEKNGYLVVNDAFSPEEIGELRRKMLEVQTKFESSGKKAKITESERYVSEPESGALRSIWGIHQEPEFLADLCREPRLLEIAQQILDDEVYVHQSRINLQPAFVGGGFYWHQDFEQWHCEDGMPRMRAVSCLVFLDRNVPQNGALMVVPGSHKVYIQSVGKTPSRNWEKSLSDPLVGAGVPDLDLVREVIDEHGIEYCTGEPGSVLFFDCNILHGSHNNISPWNRMNAYYVYNSVRNAVVDPFYAPTPRPEHIATRRPEPLRPRRELQEVHG